MKILVTGCGGFLGSEIVRQLIERGDTVVGVSRGEYPALVKLGMSHRRGDLVDRKFTIESVAGVDAVIHTAATARCVGSVAAFLFDQQARHRSCDCCLPGEQDQDAGLLQQPQCDV